METRIWNVLRNHSPKLNRFEILILIMQTLVCLICFNILNYQFAKHNRLVKSGWLGFSSKSRQSKEFKVFLLNI